MRDSQLSDRQRRHRAATMRGMKQSAEARTCPACKRKAAVKTVGLAPEGLVLKKCRWCSWEKGVRIK